MNKVKVVTALMRQIIFRAEIFRTDPNTPGQIVVTGRHGNLNFFWKEC